MVAQQATPSHAMAERLHVLLQRARSVKPSTSIDPPLQVAELTPENEDVFGPITGDREIHMNAIEAAAKNIFYGKIVSSPTGYNMTLSNLA
jgi:THO complex subunit 1